MSSLSELNVLKGTQLRNYLRMPYSILNTEIHNIKSSKSKIKRLKTIYTANQTQQDAGKQLIF